jgi:hypothetical protein
MNDLVKIRSAKPEDVAFIKDTYKKSLFDDNIFFKPSRGKKLFRKEFFDTCDLVMNSLLPKSIVRVACLKEDEDVIVGYSLTDKFKDKNVLHYVFVRLDWRRIGLSKALVNEEIHLTTHMTWTGKKIISKDTIFNPYLL